jgi:hypothetical protein
MMNAKMTTPARATRASVMRNVSITYTPSDWTAGMKAPAIASGDERAPSPRRRRNKAVTRGAVPGYRLLFAAA